MSATQSVFTLPVSCVASGSWMNTVSLRTILKGTVHPKVTIQLQSTRLSVLTTPSPSPQLAVEGNPRRNLHPDDFELKRPTQEQVLQNSDEAGNWLFR